ncbi:Panacea domain-containing protein [Lactiplantibacillus mudanjiangensis]|uniref:Antitoxin SocA-like Panacea domain-containing protein n=1 Tax=Lactiplantibacillus mudanjiangensis TaxID=1296538 RepID=A0A660DWM4_9LACO|nr:type II toxin-antitoxin system antitoxin SocA domain-containing protein [Lactiplantibacillus mudanjiangensis]VDG23480.1 hypothetical protein [Lactobacillus heilongjiangensis] [Lactiplantibacillus mudanjiangensis]VDG27758.1 hypothetical protein [Lactobacillus heilongjiangensis] [Lactiplantibacillus mudanjiangensis]
MNTTYTVDQVADWYLSHEDMSPKKLQKLLYYAYAWVLTLTNEDSHHLDNRLFNNHFEAWVHGPVLPTIYRKYREYGYHSIPKQVTTPHFTDEIDDILKQVWEEYGNYTADELESITHQEKPWQEARQNVSPLDASSAPINDRTIFDYYMAQSAI